MGTTPLGNLPFPEATDQPFVHLDLKALAEAVAEVVLLSSPTPPPHKQGRYWTDTDTGRTFVSNGARWEQVAGDPEAVVPVVPSAPFTSLSGNPLPRLVEYGGMVHLLSGLIARPTAGTFGAGSIWSPAALDPARPELFPADTHHVSAPVFAGGANTNMLTADLWVDSAGVVNVQAAGNLGFTAGGSYNTIRVPHMMWPRKP